MANIVITANILTLTSTLKTEDIKLVKKYKPEALAITNDEGDEVFRIDLGLPEIGRYGVSFNETNDDGYARVVAILAVPEGMTARDYATDLIAPVIDSLEALEHSIPEVMLSINNSRARVSSRIQVI